MNIPFDKVIAQYQIDLAKYLSDIDESEGVYLINLAPNNQGKAIVVVEWVADGYTPLDEAEKSAEAANCISMQVHNHWVSLTSVCWVIWKPVNARLWKNTAIIDGDKLKSSWFAPEGATKAIDDNRTLFDEYEVGMRFRLHQLWPHVDIQILPCRNDEAIMCCVSLLHPLTPDDIAIADRWVKDEIHCCTWSLDMSIHLFFIWKDGGRWDWQHPNEDADELIGLINAMKDKE